MYIPIHTVLQIILFTVLYTITHEIEYTHNTVHSTMYNYTWLGTCAYGYAPSIIYMDIYIYMYIRQDIIL
jgi:hypothetical protein